MNGRHVLWPVITYKVPALAVLFSGGMLLALSAAAPGVRCFYAVVEAFSYFTDAAFAQVFNAFICVMFAALKALLAFVVGSFWEQSRGMALAAIGVWLGCLLVCWLSTIAAALEMPAIAALPERTLAQLAFTWLVVEILAGLLLPIGVVALENAREAATGALANGSSDARALPRCTDLLELLVHVGGHSQTSARYDGINIAADGTMHTSQSVLADCLGVAKSSVNARLHALQRDGRIILWTNPGGTRIQLIERDDADQVSYGATAPAQRSIPRATPFGRSLRPSAKESGPPSKILGFAGGEVDGLPPNAAVQAEELATNSENAKNKLVKLWQKWNLRRRKLWTRSENHPPRPG